MINILIEECDFEIENLYYKKIQNIVVNKYYHDIQGPNPSSFIEIKKFIKNPLRLNFQ